MQCAGDGIAQIGWIRKCGFTIFSDTRRNDAVSTVRMFQLTTVITPVSVP